MTTNVIGFHFDEAKPAPRTVSKTEAARIIGVCRQTVYNYVDNGLLAETANGRITAQSINAFLKEDSI